MKNYSPNNDKFILKSRSNGEEKIFDYIFRKYYKSLCVLANIYIHDLNRSQSIVQDCFIKLWISREKMPEIHCFSSYLFLMVKNSSIDFLRKRKKEVDISEVYNLPDKNNNPEEDILSKELESEIIQRLSDLPDRCRIAFEYSRFDDYTYPEIAKKMNVSVKAVEALITRSLKILRKEFKNYIPCIVLIIRYVMYISK